ncbi:hypothetical protein OEA41_010033 [Lepraria neglecta]|uniref:Very-long-chain (3R)-3-hydroxyacyl-CoA dehydratase n=1 Tax=Lepraria neglecta TaxID=209136 RepID=A0AAD9YY93_9LECA|nr:hypothetical protein OEA41_010033 [Lepraria neglecta]
MDTRTTPHRRQQTQYLTAYNLICAVLWTAVLGRVILLVPLVGFENVAGGVGEFAKWTQTLAVLEIVHSALGLVRSPLSTTAMQVSSRLLLIWGVVNRYPAATAPSPFYSSMLLAWSVTEVIRYSYFVWNLRGNGVPGFVTWLRYNTFYVLYPIGISSECSLIWKASWVAEWPVWWVFWGVLGVYVPGSYILFTHMIAQRRKVMRGKGVEGRG